MSKNEKGFGGTYDEYRQRGLKAADAIKLSEAWMRDHANETSSPSDGNKDAPAEKSEVTSSVTPRLER